MAGNIVIGICGGSGSGKSTLARKIKDEFGDKASIVSMDSFYKFQPDTTYEERTKTNYDHPDAFDTDIMSLSPARIRRSRSTTLPYTTAAASRGRPLRQLR